MKKIFIGLVLSISIGFAQSNKEIEKTNESPAATYVSQIINKTDISSFIGMKLNYLITITNIYQDNQDRTNIVYEYTYNLRNKNIDKSKYNEIVSTLWKTYLPIICERAEIKIIFKHGAGARYIYSDHNKMLIADMIIKEKDCK